jgi:hypothetical protein
MESLHSVYVAVILMEIKEGRTFLMEYHVALHLKQHVTAEMGHLLYSIQASSVALHAPLLNMLEIIKWYGKMMAKRYRVLEMN